MNDPQLPATGNGWWRYQELVMESLESHGKRLDSIDEKMTSIRIDIATLKGKATVWGAIAGGVFGTGVTLLASIIARAMKQ